MTDQARFLTWCRWALIVLTIGFCVIIAAHFKSTDYFFLFIGPRHFGFRIALEIIIALWVTLMIFDTSVRPKRNALLYSLIILLAITAISSALGPNPAKSIWSNFERMEGWIGFLHWSAFAVLLGSIVHTLKEWAWVFLSTSIGFAYLITVGYVQKIFAVNSNSGLANFVKGFFKLFGVQGEQVQGITDSAQRSEAWNQAIVQYFSLSKSSTRIESFAGNAAYFSTLALAAFFGLLFAVVWWYSQAHKKVEEKTAKPQQAFRRAWAWLGLGGLYALFILIAFYWSETRGAVLGLAVAIVITAIIALCHKNLSKWIHYIAGYGLGAVLVLVGLFTALRKTDFVMQNRGLARFADLVSEPILIIWGIVAVLAAIALFHYKSAKKLRYAAGVVLALIIIVFGGLFAMRNTAFVEGSPMLSRYANAITGPFCGDVSQSRCKIWPIAVKGIAERPGGYGFEGFSYAFFKHSTPDLYRFEAWFDRAHNIFLDWGIYGGVLGFVLFISLFGWALWYIWRPHAEIGGRTLPVEIKLVVTASLIAYAVQGIFLFDNFFSYVWLFMTFGFCMAVASDHKLTAPIVAKRGMTRTSLMIVAAIIWILVIWGGLVVANGRSMEMNKKIIMLHRNTALVAEALRQNRVDIAERTLRSMESEIASEEVFLSPFRFEYRSQLFQLAPRLISYGEIPQLQEEAAAILNTTNLHAERQLAEQPTDTYMMYHVVMYAMVTGQMETGLAVAQEALKINPTKQIILAAAADMAFQTGKADISREYVAAIASSTPTDDPLQALVPYQWAAEGRIERIPDIFAFQLADSSRFHQYLIVNAVRFKQYNFLRAYVAELRAHPQILAMINREIPNLIPEAQRVINTSR